MTDNMKQMSLWEHIGELRWRLLRSVLAYAVAVFICFNVAEFIIKFILAAPIGGVEYLESIEVAENFGVFLRTSLLAGFILALPIILWQMLGFITPGLLPHERKWVYGSILPATVLFIAGVAFTYFVMLPAAIPFLVNFMGIKTTPRLSNYIDFTTTLMFWVGVAFEAPLVMFILAKLGIVNARGLIKQWRIAIVVIAFLAAFITPTGDPVNMSILMAPLLALYLLSIFLAWIAGKPRQEKKPKALKPKTGRRWRLFRRKPKAAKPPSTPPPVEGTEAPPESGAKK